MKNGQTSVLFKYFVKNQLKKQDLRYSDLAEHLNLSLAAVKKIMTEGDFKLSRMESIASWLGFTLLEALQIIDNESYAKSFLTPSQEKILANDPMNFYVLILLVCCFSLKEVSSRTQISQQNLQKILLILDKAGIIELYSNNKFRILISPPYHMDLKGPLYKRLIPPFLKVCCRQVEKENKGALLFKAYEMYMTDEFADKFKKEINTIADHYLKLSKISARANQSTKLKPVTILLFLNQHDSWREVLLAQSRS
jgi:hypothetical protein